MDSEGRILVDFIGRFERLQADFQTVCARIGRTVSLPHVKNTEHAHYRECYTPETREIIAEWFKEHIELFGYEF